MTGMRGWHHSGGRPGIRNVVAVAHPVECAREAAHVIGFPGCCPNPYARKMMERLCIHPTVGVVLPVSLGCESFDRFRPEQVIADSGRPVRVVTIQNDGGTRTSIAAGREWVTEPATVLAAAPTVPMAVSELVVGTVCGGSVVGSAPAPVPKIAANPHRHARLAEDMDVNAGAVLGATATLEGVGQEIFDPMIGLAGGHQSTSEELGHREFILTYKSFEPVGPACRPV